jgi:Zn-finger nucleic acid-binding protein
VDDAYRDSRRLCPHCTEDVALSPNGPKLECQRCQGVFVPTADLADMIATMTDRPPPTAKHADLPRNRRCPVCSVVMTETSLWTVPVERCDEHGTWFDWKELALALEYAGGGLGPQSAWQRFWRELFVPRKRGARTPVRPDDL